MNDLPADAFATEGAVLTFGVVPTRVDMVNRIDGVSFDEARANVVRGTYGGVKEFCRSAGFSGSQQQF